MWSRVEKGRKKVEFKWRNEMVRGETEHNDEEEVELCSRTESRREVKAYGGARWKTETRYTEL